MQCSILISENTRTNQDKMWDKKKQYCNCICKKISMEAGVFMTSMNTTISNLKYKQSMEYIANLL